MATQYFYKEILSADKLKEDAYLKYSEQTDCKAIDRNIKELDVRIADYRKMFLKPPSFIQTIKKTEYYIEFVNAKRVISTLEKIRQDLKAQFIRKNCQFNLEKLKLEESADVLSDKFSQYDVDVLEKSKPYQTYLLIGGGVVLLTGLYLIIRK